MTTTRHTERNSRIYYYVTGILNPTKSEVLDEEESESGSNTETDTKEETNMNYTRRKVTFVFEIDSGKFLEKMKTSDHVLKSMKFTKIHFITQTDYTYRQIANTQSVDPEEYEDIDPFYVLFKATDQGIKVDCAVKDVFPGALTEKQIGTMCANEYDTFTFIESEFDYTF